MIDSTLLPDHHKDTFDRILIAQALRHGMLLVSRDPRMQEYDAPIFWI